MSVVSLCVVLFRSDEEQVRQLISVFKRAVDNLEFRSEVVVVINDDREYRDIQADCIVHTDSNIGFGTGMNIAMQNSTGSLILLSNPDINWKEDDLVRFIGGLAKRPNSIVVPILTNSLGEIDRLAYMDWNYSALRRLGKWRASRFLDGKNEDIPKGVKAPGAVLGFSREVGEILGPFDETFFLYGEDRDLHRRAVKLGFDVWLDRSVVIEHEGGKSGRDVAALVREAQYDSALRLLWKNGGRLSLVAGYCDLLLVGVMKLGSSGLSDLVIRSRVVWRWRSPRSQALRRHVPRTTTGVA